MKDTNLEQNHKYEDLITIIENTHLQAFKLLNTTFIDMYWDIGKYISEKVKNEGWQKSVVRNFSDYLNKSRPDLKGFSASNIWRMKQFYETYSENEKLAPLVRQISWTNNLIIMSRSKSEEEREFYLVLTLKNNYSKRELSRQIDSMLFHRTIISEHNTKFLEHKSYALSSLRDNYLLEFLDIPEVHKEKELREAIVSNLKNFILEFGKDFTFVGEEYRVQVGNKDYYIDLLFYNRALSCLVAIELKVTDFEPEFVGKMQFYLEALNRDVKLPNENPSVGLILCASKDQTVVEYAMSNNITPTMIADYNLLLPNKKLIEKKLDEIRELANANETEEDFEDA